MRYIAPSREVVDPAVFARRPLVEWRQYDDWLRGPAWPSVAQLNDALPARSDYAFVPQTAALLADGRHYEQRIAEVGQIATREGNWHDLFNALVWLRYPAIKQALNRRQVDEIRQVGPKQRSRPQYAMTHFDEAGVMVAVSDPSLIELWDAHDWYGLFWRRRQAWLDGSIRWEVFGHALLEHALTPDKLLVGKALAFEVEQDAHALTLRQACARAIADGRLLHDPLELRPLPLSGLPGWLAAGEAEHFHRETACYQPRRVGRTYPRPDTSAIPACRVPQSPIEMSAGATGE